MELLSPEWRYEPVPFVNGIAPDAKGPRYGGLIAAEILKNVRFTQSANTVLCSRPAVYSGRVSKYPSGGLVPLLGSPGMDKKKRRVQRRFNGDVIRKLRRERGDMSLEQLAQLAGTTRGNISKIELSREYVAISWDVWLGICKALYIPPERLAELVSGAEVPAPRGRPATPVAPHKRNPG